MGSLGHIAFTLSGGLLPLRSPAVPSFLVSATQELADESGPGGHDQDTTPYQTGMLDTSFLSLLRGGDDLTNLASRSPAGFLPQEDFLVWVVGGPASGSKRRIW